MTKEQQILTACRNAGKVGEVSHDEYANYVIIIGSNPYMPADGRVAMARADHRKQGKKLDMYPPSVLVDNEESLTLSVSIESEIYGKANGTATSKKVKGSANEKDYPFEAAETSALGRALAEMGYGVFAGTGLTSAEDMIRMGERPEPPVSAPKSSTSTTQTNGNKPQTIAKPPVLNTAKWDALVERAVKAKLIPDAKNQTMLFMALEKVGFVEVNDANINAAWAIIQKELTVTGGA